MRLARFPGDVDLDVGVGRCKESILPGGGPPFSIAHHPSAFLEPDDLLETFPTTLNHKYSFTMTTAHRPTFDPVRCWNATIHGR